MPQKEEQYRVKRQNPKAQNPAQGKKPLSLEEKRRLEARRRERARIARENALLQKKLRRERRKYLFQVSLRVGLAFAILYWCWVGISIATRPDGNEEAMPLMIFTEGERQEDKTLTVEESSFGGKVYMPVTELEAYMAISQFWDYKTRSFLICESGEYATFFLDTTAAIINGQRVSLKEKVFLKDDVLYLPIDFYSDKMNCFTFAQSVPLAANVLTFREDVAPAMQFHGEAECAPVDPGTIPAPAPAPAA